MPSTVLEQSRPWLKAICPECDGLYLAAGPATSRTYIQAKADQHDLWAHPDDAVVPRPHYIAHVNPKLIGYTVECICLYQESVPDIRSTESWRCPLDRT